jgi:hypothetical protein
MNDNTSAMLLGAIAATSIAIGLFFFKYWRSSRDRFHLLFAASFLIEGLNRTAVGVAGLSEYEPLNYGIRFFSYALIVVAIWDKNRQR